MGRPPRRDDDGRDIRGGDQLFARGIGFRAGQARGDRLRLRRVDVADRDDPRAGQDVRQPTDMLLPDHPDADHADIQSHGLVLPIRSARRAGRPLHDPGAAARDGSLEPGPIPTGEFAENSELTAIFSAGGPLRPLFCGGNAGEIGVRAEMLAANWNSEFTRRLSEFFRQNSEFDARDEGHERLVRVVPSSDLRARSARKHSSPNQNSTR